MATAYQNLSDYDFNSVPDGSEMTFGIVVAEWNKPASQKTGNIPAGLQGGKQGKPEKYICVGGHGQGIWHKTKGERRKKRRKRCACFG